MKKANEFADSLARYCTLLSIQNLSLLMIIYQICCVNAMFFSRKLYGTSLFYTRRLSTMEKESSG